MRSSVREASRRRSLSRLGAVSEAVSEWLAVLLVAWSEVGEIYVSRLEEIAEQWNVPRNVPSAIADDVRWLLAEVDRLSTERDRLADALKHAERTIGNLVACVRNEPFRQWTDGQREWQTTEGTRIRESARAVLAEIGATK